jgi:GH24 family phage-related lysozyme (muramidase)
MTGNLIGEEFDQYVFDQIRVRQATNAKGFGDVKMSSNDIQVINNKSSFLKLASGVDIFQTIPEPNVQDPNNPTVREVNEAIKQGILDEDALYISSGGVVVPKSAKRKFKSIINQIRINNSFQTQEGITKLRQLGFNEPEIKLYGKGSKLAKKSILFGGLGTYGRNDLSSSSTGNSIIPRSGISLSNSVFNQTKAYGLGGGQFGKQPMPGITSAKINCINRGSIRTATIQIKAYNTFQFQLIELLYLRLGFTMMLEWGHNKFQAYENGKAEAMGPTIIEETWFGTYQYTQLQMLQLIEQKRQFFCGNYDGFFGRVTNFNWSFSPDGTYDITLKLTTLGDIIESLQINLPTQIKNFSPTSKTPVNAPNLLTLWLDDFIKGDTLNGAIWGSGKYINLKSINFKRRLESEIYSFKLPDGEVITGNTNNLRAMLRLKVTASNIIRESINQLNIDDELKKLKAVTFGNFSILDGLNKENSYFVTFGELLEKIYNNILPRVSNSGGDSIPIMGMGLDEELNVVSAQPNQISFDLNICYIKPYLNAVGVDVPSILTQNGIKPFFVLDKEGDNDVFYGKLLNVYLNFDFIKKQLDKSESGGSLSLYKFLNGICQGINSALGSVNKIEPVINTEENKIVFVDQNPIKGNTSVLKKLLDFVPSPVEITPIEVFGINTEGKTPQSNFVKNFSFDTKIGPQLASMMAIGATAGTSTSKSIDGTIFSKMNSGLQDRFQKTLLPAPGFLSQEEQQKAAEEAITEDLRAEFDDYWGDLTTTADGKTNYNTKFNSTNKKTGNASGNNSIEWAPQFKGNNTGGNYGGKSRFLTYYNFKTGTYKGFSFINQSRGTTWGDYKRWKATTGKDIIAIEDINLSSSYQTWLTYAMGGSIVGKKRTDGSDFNIPVRDALYLNLSNTNFFKQGKAAFREYIKVRDEKIFRLTNQPSNQGGFLPIELSLTLDGISGIKIYQKINVNQKFLPVGYQTNTETGTLDFVIKKVDHELKDNSWVTNLSTISIPPSPPSNTRLMDDGVFSYLQIDENAQTNATNNVTERTVTGTAQRFPVDQLSPDAFIKEHLKNSEGYYSKSANSSRRGNYQEGDMAYAYPDPKSSQKLAEIKADPNYKTGDESLPWTIGYGQTYYAQGQKYERNGVMLIGKGTESSSPVKEFDKIDTESADIGFELVLNKIVKTMVARNRIKVPLTQNEYNALASFSYNSGPGVADYKKDFYNLFNSGKYVEAGLRLQTTGTNNGLLTSRRMGEADIWFMDNPGNPS